MPLTIDIQPQNQTATQGDVATFSVSVSGATGTVLYQWYEGGVFMLGQNAASLDVEATLLRNGAEFYVVVSDDVDTLQSDNAVLTVNLASNLVPVLQGPDDTVVRDGDIAVFRVVAFGGDPFTYQWRVAGGAALPGETGPVLEIESFQRNNNTFFEVVVTDVSGLQTVSRAARLTVLEALPKIDTSLADVDWPCALPGPLVAANAYQSKARTRRIDVAAGPPIFEVIDDGGYEAFSVGWDFSGAQVQAFRDWFRYLTESGSKLFNMPLWVDGPRECGGPNTKTHQCYFEGTPEYTQQGKRWRVSAQLIAIEEEIESPCDNIVELFDVTCGELKPVILGFAEIFPPLPPEPPDVPPGPLPPECFPYDCAAFVNYVLSINPLAYYPMGANSLGVPTFVDPTYLIPEVTGNAEDMAAAPDADGYSIGSPTMGVSACPGSTGVQVDSDPVSARQMLTGAPYALLSGFGALAITTGVYVTKIIQPRAAMGASTFDQITNLRFGTELWNGSYRRGSPEWGVSRGWNWGIAAGSSGNLRGLFTTTPLSSLPNSGNGNLFIPDLFDKNDPTPILVTAGFRLEPLAFQAPETNNEPAFRMRLFLRADFLDGSQRTAEAEVWGVFGLSSVFDVSIWKPLTLSYTPDTTPSGGNFTQHITANSNNPIQDNQLYHNGQQQEELALQFRRGWNGYVPPSYCPT